MMKSYKNLISKKGSHFSSNKKNQSVFVETLNLKMRIELNWTDIEMVFVL